MKFERNFKISDKIRENYEKRYAICRKFEKSLEVICGKIYKN